MTGQGPAWGLGPRVRLGLFALAAGWIWIRAGLGPGLHAVAGCAGLAALELVRHSQERRGAGRASIAAAAAFGQYALIGLLAFAPAPVGFGSDQLGSGAPPPLVLESPLFLLFTCLLASHADAARPRTVFIAGAGVLAVWIAALAWTTSRPWILTRANLHPRDFKTWQDVLRATTAASYFNFDLWKFDLAVGVTMILILGLGALRLNQLARDSAAREARRAALAAYFSADVIMAASEADALDLTPRTREVAVLDCDLVGFTALVERLSPEQAARALTRYRALVEAAVFAHGGAVLAHAGDGVIAVFGLAGGSDEAAARAADAGLAIVRQWDQQGPDIFPQGAPGLALGLDAGQASVGLVGEARATALLVLGEPVTGAAAMQMLTRQVGAPLLIGVKAAGAIAQTRAGVTLTPVPGTAAFQVANPSVS